MDDNNNLLSFYQLFEGGESTAYMLLESYIDEAIRAVVALRLRHQDKPQLERYLKALQYIRHVTLAEYIPTRKVLRLYNKSIDVVKKSMLNEKFQKCLLDHSQLLEMSELDFIQQNLNLMNADLTEIRISLDSVCHLKTLGRLLHSYTHLKKLVVYNCIFGDYIAKSIQSLGSVRLAKLVLEDVFFSSKGLIQLVKNLDPRKINQIDLIIDGTEINPEKIRKALPKGLEMRRYDFHAVCLYSNCFEI
ncbi:hypothetical protein OAT84_01645 [Gammaproteobacteria bacterium]|nr:hypothetical protein [Gammaproteobacteria bacterium]